MNPELDSTFTNQIIAKNYAKFYQKWVRNNFQSEKQGTEIGEYKDYIMIVCPGQPKSEMHRAVADRDKKEYPSEWADYKEGRDQRLTGTPIDILPGIDKGRADSLKALYLYSIEQLADMSDLSKQKVGMGASELQKRAKDFLIKGNSEISELKARIAELEQKLAKPKLGRPLGSTNKVKDA